MATGDIPAFTPAQQNGQTIDAPREMGFLNSIRNAFNGGITNNQIAALAGIVESKLNLAALALTNLVRNADMEAWGATDEAPADWANVSTAVIAQEGTEVETGCGNYCAKVEADGSTDEGLSQILTNLKASTKYRVSVRVKVTAGDTASITTTGATTNMDEDSTSTSWATVTGTFTTDGSGTDVVLQLLAQNNGGIVYFDRICVTEGTAKVGFIQNNFVDRGDAAADDYELADLTEDGSFNDLDLSAIVPPSAVLILLKVGYQTNTLSKAAQFRKAGNSNAYNISQIIPVVVDVITYQDIEVPCDASQVIEYSLASTETTETNITVKGWWNG